MVLETSPAITVATLVVRFAVEVLIGLATLMVVIPIVFVILAP